MPSNIKLRLSVFMFLQYFTWGCWYASMGAYLTNTLKFTGGEIGLAYGAFAVGAMISPFFVGLVADRYFATEKLLGVLGVLGGVLLVLLPRMTAFPPFYALLIVYCATYVPTLALGNSLSLHQLPDAKKDFPQVKVLSAVGWVAAGLVVTACQAEQVALQFYLAGATSVVLGLYSLTLPHTPPKKVGENVPLREILGLDALGLLRKPSFAIFIGCMFLICIPLYFYFVNVGIYLTESGWPNFARALTLAQVSDVVFLLLLPLMLHRLGYKKTIALGIIAWATRYFLLAQSVNAATLATSFIIGAILLHGVCYDFLFIAGQLYVDEECNERMRGAAQGFIAFILWGVGAFVGTLLAGKVMEAHVLAEPVNGFVHDWHAIWRIPAWGAVGVLAVFALFFRGPGKGLSEAVEEEEVLVVADDPAV
ncbi:MAG: MFS transporter [Candidatus Hydrogenedentes bacterium]|nr:MFS transporter [Candidatus Hydrogenedentota bacterium]